MTVAHPPSRFQSFQTRDSAAAKPTPSQIARCDGLRRAIGECLPRDHSLVLLYNVCSKRVTHLRNCPHFKTQLNCSSCLGVSDKCFHSFAVSPPALPRAACASWWGVARSSADDCSCLWLNLDRNVLSSALPPAAKDVEMLISIAWSPRRDDARGMCNRAQGLAPMVEGC